MPIYVYEPTLTSDDQVPNDCCYFESFESVSASPQSVCPTCGGAVHRALTGFLVGAPKSARDESGPFSGLSSSSSSGAETSAGRAARMAMRHICRAGCAH